MRWLIADAETVLVERVHAFRPRLPSRRACARTTIGESVSKGRGSSRSATFLAARPFTREEVFTEPGPVPSMPGVQGWWFRTVPGAIDVSGCEQRDGLTLLYVGISPTAPPKNGKPPSTQDLRKRIRYHFGGGKADAEGSTLRKTLGVLLGDELGFKLRRIGTGDRRTFAGGEAILNQWMAENALVSWLVHPEPWLLEDKLIDRTGPPAQCPGQQQGQRVLPGVDQAATRSHAQCEQVARTQGVVRYTRRREPAQPQAVAHHEHRTESHCRTGDHRVEQAQRGQRDRGHVVGERPEQVCP